MSEYEAGKDAERFNRELQITQNLLQSLYEVVEHNLKIGVLKEPKKKKE